MKVSKARSWSECIAVNTKLKTIFKWLNVLSSSHFFISDTLKEARILISIVVVFIFCQSFTIVADAYEAFTCSYEKMRKSMCPSNPTIENIIDFSHFLLTINSSINFALYVIHDKTFKEAIVKVTKMYIICIVY